MVGNPAGPYCKSPLCTTCRLYGTVFSGGSLVTELCERTSNALYSICEGRGESAIIRMAFMLPPKDFVLGSRRPYARGENAPTVRIGRGTQPTERAKRLRFVHAWGDAFHEATGELCHRLLLIGGFIRWATCGRICSGRSSCWKSVDRGHKTGGTGHLTTCSVAICASAVRSLGSRPVGQPTLTEERAGS